MSTPIAVTIAGSDSGGGEGIQADLKTFGALGVYGASVIVALTAQNTQAVTGIHDVPPDFIRAQMDAVFSDHHIERCDFLKLDCEGAEYEIIYAASPKTLARIHRIAMEYHDRVDKVTKAKELVAFLIGHGFRIVDFTDFVGHDCGFIRMER